MIGLLDTHTLMWWDSDDTKLSPTAKAFIEDAGNVILISVVSLWEIVIKSQLGKLPMSKPLDHLIADQLANGLQLLPVTLDHVLAVRPLPAPHKDTFDRLLVAQAIAERAVLVSADPVFAGYPVTAVW